MEVEYKASFMKDLKGKDKSVLRKLKSTLEEIECADTPNNISHMIKIKGAEFYYRIRIGEYRVGLKIENNKIIIIRFLHRKEIYRYFP